MRLLESMRKNLSNACISIVPYSICPNCTNVVPTGYKICLGAPVRTFDICTLQLERNHLSERKLSDTNV